MKKYQVDENGFYGQFGGAFVPEVLKGNIEELQKNYLPIIESEDFRKEYDYLMKYYVGRPSPLYYSPALSQKYGAKIYLKREDLNHTGSHKLNNTIGQALLAKRLGKNKLIAETGAGSHGVATATVAALLGMECIIYMGAVDMERQKPNVERMRMLGAEVRPAESGQKTLKEAVDECLMYWVEDHEKTHYLIGSAVGPHPFPDMVARFQSIISEEIKLQLTELEGRENPDYVIACIGGGSNAIGAFYNFLDDDRVKLIAAEGGGLGAESGKTAASANAGKVGILHGSKNLILQDENGEVAEAYSISAGLDYPGIGPLHAYLHETGRARYIPVTDQQAVKAAFRLSRMEGIVPALESSHALAVLDLMKFGKDDVVVINLSGRGDKDMKTLLEWKDKIDMASL